ncbi:MAG: hypothetical protein E6614_09635, partial [Bradyrhizobium sp.]|nr:hypothetical protein [Bradyrhizobium sp.]
MRLGQVRDLVQSLPRLALVAAGGGLGDVEGARGRGRGLGLGAVLVGRLVHVEGALAEVLVTKNYLFPKPDAVRTSLGRVLGYGILLAEGDE